MNDIKSMFTSKTVLTGLAVSVAGALGLGGVVTPEIVNAVVLVGGALVVLFRKMASTKLV